MAKAKQKYTLLGRHDKLDIGDTIELTEAEAKKDIFKNKIQLVGLAPKDDAAVKKAGEQAAKMIADAKAQATAIIEAAEDEAETKAKAAADAVALKGKKPNPVLPASTLNSEKIPGNK